VYTDRTSSNYEGSPDYRDGDTNFVYRNKHIAENLAPFRYEMIKNYDVPRKASLV